MIDARSMLWVKWEAQPHESHKFTKRESTLVACASNDRFGSVRECKNCGLQEVWAGGAGSHYFDHGLDKPCTGDK